MENVKDFSTFGAFRALREMDEEVEIKVKAKKLDEGSSFPVNDPVAMQAAEDMRNADNKKDVDLEIVDSNADDDEHVRNNSAYVGDRVLKCKTCGATRNVPKDVAEKQEDGNWLVKDNTTGYTNECPICHKSDVTYDSMGIIAAEQPEATVDNDLSDVDEPKFDNDHVDETPAEPEDATPADGNNNPDEWGGFEKYDAADDLDYTDTDAADDTEDVKDTTGDEFDPDDNVKDDTEPEAANFDDDNEDEKSKKESLREDIPLDEDDNQEEEELPEELPDDMDAEPETKDSTDSEGDVTKEEPTDEPEMVAEPTTSSFYTVGELLSNKFILPDEIKEIIIYDMDLDKELFKGKLSEMSKVFKDAVCAAFEVTGKNIIANISVDGSEGNGTLKDAIEDLKGDDIIVNVYDRTTDMDMTEGKAEEVLEKFGRFNFVGFEVPGTLKIIMRSDATEPEEVKESLVEKIIKHNGYKVENLSKPFSTEYWINEELESKEDLDKFVEEYLQNVDEALMKEFCESTGYVANAAEMKARAELVERNCYGVVYGYTRGNHTEELMEHIFAEDADHLDRIVEALSLKENADIKYVVNESPVTSDDEDEVDLISLHNENCKLACTHGKPVIYGYMGDDHGKNKYIPLEPIICDDLAKCTKEIEDRCHPTGSILVAYPDECECLHFKSRKELAEAISKVRNNNQPYTVTRSMVEGYRWTLIKRINESPISRDDYIRNHDIINTSVKASVEDLNESVSEPTYKCWVDCGTRDDIERNAIDYNCKIEVVGEEEDLSNLYIYGQPEDIENLVNDFGSGFDSNNWVVSPESLRNTDEELVESKKDDELPVDTEAVKAQTHGEIAALVTDEVEAIQGYEEVKAAVQDAPIEKKDEIVDKLDHIEDEEKEHIDELIELADEIPFDKEDSEKVSETADEVSQEPEDETPVDTPVDGDGTQGNDKHANESVDEAIIRDDGNVQLSFDDYDDKGELTVNFDYDKVLPIDYERKDKQLALEYEKEFNSLNNVDYSNTKDEIDINQEFDESLLESFINNHLDESLEETVLFEARNGYVDDNGNMLIEGVYINCEDGTSTPVCYTLTPEKTVNESLGIEETHYKVTNNLSEEVLTY